MMHPNSLKNLRPPWKRGATGNESGVNGTAISWFRKKLKEIGVVDAIPAYLHEMITNPDSHPAERAKAVEIAAHYCFGKPVDNPPGEGAQYDFSKLTPEQLTQLMELQSKARVQSVEGQNVIDIPPLAANNNSATPPPQTAS